MIRRTTAARGLALAAVLSLGLAACSTSTDEGTADTSSSAAADPLKVGTLLPVTGTLAFLGPPEIAGVGLAVDEINDAGGVLGSDVELTQADSGDSTDMTVSTQSATDLIGQGVSVVIGAASSSVSQNVQPTLNEAGVMQISPANTATDLSGVDSLFSRTAPPDTVQGSALGSLVLDDGHTNVAILAQNESYGTGLRDNVQKAIEAGGGSVVYGAEGAGQEFQPGESNFSAIVTSALAQKPDAIVVIAFEETVAIVNELVAQGWDFDGTTYFCDGNTASYADQFDAGTLEGVVGTIPGAQAEGEFRDAVSGWWEESEGQPLSDFSYAAESYDAVMLAALAAVRGGATDGQTISDNIQAVSGAEGGTECTTYAECVEALESGDEIHYEGKSGIGPLNADNDPSSAFIGVYAYAADNTNAWTRAIEGKVE
jgi:branched-chain amino acid transport system substrate-binding protein